MTIDTCQDRAVLSYMSLRAVKQSDTLLTVEANGLTLAVTCLSCTYVDSQPTGATNEAVTQSFLNRFQSNKPAPDKDGGVPDNLSN